MARLSKELSEQDYEDLVMLLVQSTDPDAELQDCISAYLRPNQKFYLMMSRAISKIRDAATLSSDGGQISDSENLKANLYELENKLLENSNIIPADLPDSILNDRDLVGRHLADNSKIIYQKDEWRDFQSYIEDKVGTISKNLELPFLEWCDKMLKRNYAKHKEICTKRDNCPMNESYDKRIQYVLRLIEDATPYESEPVSIQMDLQTQDSGLRLSDRKGAKIDLIRIVNAMWELGFFTEQNGLKSSKLSAMIAVGNALQIDLSEYDKDLSQAFSTANPDTNTKIFKELEVITKKMLEK